VKVILTLWSDERKFYDADGIEEDFPRHKFYVLKGEKRIAGYWLKHVSSWELVEELSTHHISTN
jgi:hypothetical protein